MSLINRLSSGRIFVDEFNDPSLNPIWQVSPTDPARYSANIERDGFLRMKHGEIPFYMLMDMPNRDFVFEIRNEYAPKIEGDTGGIVIYQDNDTRIDLLEYFDPELGSVNYTHMRVTKKGNVYTGYGSNDEGKTWHVIGAGTAEEMPKIGLSLYHPQKTGSVNFDVDYVKIFADTKFVVSNISEGMRARLVSNTGVKTREATCFTGKDHLFIDMANLSVPFNGRLEIYNKDGALIDTSALMDIWGGDVFWYGMTVEIIRKGTVVPKDQETPMGYMVNGYIEETMHIRNPGTDIISNIMVSVSSYFDYLGHEWVMVSEDNGANYPLSYQKTISLGMLYGGESRKIWVRVRKEVDLNNPLMGDRKFLLEVTH